MATDFGSCLCCLFLTSLFHQNDVTHPEHCSKLEDLTLPIPRSRGDAWKVANYRTLVSLPWLQVMNLFLSAFNSNIQQAYYEAEDHYEQELG